MPFSNYTDQALLNSLLGKTSSFGALATAPAVYVGLSSTTPTPKGGNITEPSTGAYARVNIPAASFAAAANQDPVWPANTAEALNFLIVDSNGNQQKITTAGTTGASAPAWNLIVGGTTTDNTATWTNEGQDPNQIDNSATVTFAQATASWLSGVNLTDAVFFDALTAGNFLGFGALSVAKPVLANDTFSFPIADLIFQNT